MTYNSLLKDFKAVTMTALIVSAGMLTACSGEKAADDLPTREITLRAEGLTADMVRNSVVPI